MNKKLEILTRLLKTDQITMEEVFILCDKVEQVVPYVPPYEPWNNPWVGSPSPTYGGTSVSANLNLNEFPQSKTLTEYVNSKKN